MEFDFEEIPKLCREVNVISRAQLLEYEKPLQVQRTKNTAVDEICLSRTQVSFLHNFYVYFDAECLRSFSRNMKRTSIFNDFLEWIHIREACGNGMRLETIKKETWKSHKMNWEWISFNPFHEKQEDFRNLMMMREILLRKILRTVEYMGSCVGILLDFECLCSLT